MRQVYVWSDDVDGLVHLPELEFDKPFQQPLGFLAKHAKPKPKPKPKPAPKKPLRRGR